MFTFYQTLLLTLNVIFLAFFAYQDYRTRSIPAWSLLAWGVVTIIVTILVGFTNSSALFVQQFRHIAILFLALISIGLLVEIYTQAKYFTKVDAIIFSVICASLGLAGTVLVGAYLLFIGIALKSMKISEITKLPFATILIVAYIPAILTLEFILKAIGLN